MSDEKLIAIGERNGKVVLMFPKPTTEFQMDAENARRIAEQLARSAYTAHFGREPSGKPRSMVTESLRKHMRARVKLVVRSLLEQGKSWQYISQHVVDLILREVV